MTGTDSVTAWRTPAQIPGMAEWAGVWRNAADLWLSAFDQCACTACDMATAQLRFAVEAALTGWRSTGLAAELVGTEFAAAALQEGRLAEEVQQTAQYLKAEPGPYSPLPE